MEGIESIGAIGKGKISDIHPLRSFYTQKSVAFVV